MSVLIRIVLTWLLMLAIPVQGFAATAMLFCAPSHHTVVATIKTTQMALDLNQVATSSLAEHQHGNEQHASHHDTDAKKSVANSQANDSAPTHGTSVKVGKLADGKCSACAMCCTGSVISSTLSMSTVAMTGSDSIPFALESFVSYVPEGFDPPPRSLLA